MGEELSKYHYYRALFGPQVKHHLNGVSLACRLWSKIESWLGSFMILRGSRPVMLNKNYIFVIFEGKFGPPVPPHMQGGTVSAHALHLPVSKSRANVLLVFQYPGVYLTWVETIWSQIRIKSEVGTVKHVEALQFFFLLAQISSIVFLNVKNLAFTPYSVCVCVCVCVCWWLWRWCVCVGGGVRTL